MKSKVNNELLFQELLKTAFKFCLIGRWILIDSKLLTKRNEGNSFIANNFLLAKLQNEKFLTLYEFFKHFYAFKIEKLNFSLSNEESFFISNSMEDNKENLTNEIESMSSKLDGLNMF